MQEKTELLKIYGQATELLPPRIRRAANALSDEDKIKVNEIHLRAGRPLSVSICGKEKVIDNHTSVLFEEISLFLDIVTHGSVHTVQSSINRGYITASGGHRIGLCGSGAKLSSGEVTMRDISSVCIRVAREIKGFAKDVFLQVVRSQGVLSSIIISPPGHGKTTMLRDLVRCVSDAGYRVSLVDERGELAAKRKGVSQFDVGMCTDVLDGTEKAYGSLLMLRTMSPEVIALDEITETADTEAISKIANCGVGIIATIHGESAEEVFSKPIYRGLQMQKIFKKAIVLKKEKGIFTYKVSDV